jgi:DNA-binding response OmpR family regulator
MRVLIVEDEAFFGLGLEDELVGAGHTVIGPVASVTGALKAAREQSPDVALVDLDLQSRQDPMRLARELIAMNIPALVISSLSERTDTLADVAIGSLCKPFELDVVPSALEVAKTIIGGGKPPPPPIPLALTLFARP